MGAICQSKDSSGKGGTVRNEGRGDLIEETMQHSVRKRRPKTVTCT